uniref:F-box/LRR-repeat protein 15-like leucin rich repeat domain-containing protein n=1 Tax=Amphiprion percula TaxID=161767 RepID=A0A3P8S651_AMPPE
MLVQKIVEGCPCLLYLNLSYTLVTNKTLRELSRNCLSLQYLSLAYCYRFTDKGFLYLTTGKGWRNLIHLDLSGCTQMTVNGFRYIAAGCPALREIVINDMPTLSDSCILVSALLAKCHCLSAISLLDAPHLSDVAFKAIAEAAKLKTFSTEGEVILHLVTLVQLFSISSPHVFIRQQPADRRQLESSVQQLTGPPQTPRCRMSQNDRCRPQICGLSQKPAILGHLILQQVCFVVIAADSMLFFIMLLDIMCLCFRVSDVGIKYLTKGSSANKLKELNVSHCSHITDTSVMRIQKLCKNVRDLEHVDVSHCAALTDAAVRSFAFYCRGLVTLRMSDCPKLTDMAVQYLTSGSQYLQELDVSGCILLTDRTIRHLERICPPLCSITMACCSGISRAAALKLQSRVAYWEHSNDDPTYWFGQIVHPIIKPIRTNDTLEVTEQHSVMTTAASTKRT